jgi:hypothetical protein
MQYESRGRRNRELDSLICSRRQCGARWRWDFQTTLGSPKETFADTPNVGACLSPYLLESNSQGGDGVVVRTTLQPREHCIVDGVLQVIKDLHAPVRRAPRVSTFLARINFCYIAEEASKQAIMKDKPAVSIPTTEQTTCAKHTTELGEVKH